MVPLSLASRREKDMYRFSNNLLSIYYTITKVSYNFFKFCSSYEIHSVSNYLQVGLNEIHCIFQLSASSICRNSRN